MGLPKLRAGLQAHPPLWRRILVREEITGLLFEEMEAFLEHHFPSGQGKRLCERGLSALFERAKGAPGLLLPMARAVLARAEASMGKIDPAHLEETLVRWDLG